MGKLYCCVPGCHSTSLTVTSEGAKVIMRRIPMGEARKAVRRQWIAVLKTVRANLFVKKGTRVCSKHFEGEYTSISIPSLFPLKPPKSPPKQRRPLVRIANNNNDTVTDDGCQLNHAECVAAAGASSLSEASDCTDTDDTDSLDMGSPHNDHAYAAVGETAIDMPSGSGAEVHFTPPRTPVTLTKPVMVDVATQTDLPHITFEHLKGKDAQVRFYTGFVSFTMFWAFFQTLMKHGADRLNYWQGEKRSTGDKDYHLPNVGKPGRKRVLRPVDEFILVCMRLRLGLLQEHLGDIFRVFEASVSRIVNTWIHFMFDHSKSLVYWPSREQIMSNLPRLFADFKQVRVVIDCT
jgi:hypothetical protein